MVFVLLNNHNKWLTFWQCEDIYLVRREIERGEKQLNTVQSFYTGSDLMDLFNGAKILHDKYGLLLTFFVSSFFSFLFHDLT